MQIDSRKIAVEKDKNKKAMKVSIQSQIMLKSNSVYRQSGFYNSLSGFKQNKVTGILKELDNLKNPAAWEEVKNKLMDESERMDRLPDPKYHKKIS